VVVAALVEILELSLGRPEPAVGVAVEDNGQLALRVGLELGQSAEAASEARVQGVGDFRLVCGRLAEFITVSVALAVCALARSSTAGRS